MKIKCIDKNSKEFPEKLKRLQNCPKEIYVLGNEKILSEFSIAMIGSRRCSTLGKFIADDIAKELSLKGITIVSGFARGIDTVVHNACVKNNEKTIVVLGGGHEKIYPKENKYMIEEILKYNGAIISEYPLKYPPLPNNFRERNRIIAALSDGVVLIEARKNSGSLITISHAKRLNKKIFAVPGSLNDELYEGSNLVLKDGAYCVRNATDIIEKYDGIEISEKKIESEKKKIDEDLENLYKNICFFPQTIDDICLKTKEPINKVLSKLMLLEIEGLIKRIDGENFIKVK